MMILRIDIVYFLIVFNMMFSLFLAYSRLPTHRRRVWIKWHNDHNSGDMGMYWTTVFHN